MRRALAWILQCIGALAVLGAVLGTIFLFFMGYYIQAGDTPRTADAIVVLGGGLYRPPHAADLYNQGLAPDVYIPRVKQGKGQKLLREVGIVNPPQHEIYRRLLDNRGVPASAIQIYGENIMSTVEEARTMADILGPGPKTVIIVTSPYHVFRARLIFEAAMPEATILATGSPYDPFPEHWWTEQYSAVSVVSETSKLVFYLLGGRFLSSDAPAQ